MKEHYYCDLCGCELIVGEDARCIHCVRKLRRIKAETEARNEPA